MFLVAFQPQSLLVVSAMEEAVRDELREQAHEDQRETLLPDLALAGGAEISDRCPIQNAAFHFSFACV